MEEMEQRDKDLKERIKWLIRYDKLNDANFCPKGAEPIDRPCLNV